MPQIIKTGGGLLSKGEQPRIKLEKNTIEVSTNEGRSLSQRCNNSSYGTFHDLFACEYAMARKGERIINYIITTKSVNL